LFSFVLFVNPVVYTLDRPCLPTGGMDLTGLFTMNAATVFETPLRASPHIAPWREAVFLSRGVAKYWSRGPYDVMMDSH
jgi:hypothetical protein